MWFLLIGSGHIAGPINPPSANKYFYLTNPKQVVDPDEWLKDAKLAEGSLVAGLVQVAEQERGRQSAGPLAGAGKLLVIEDAPGAYLKARLVK